MMKILASVIGYAIASTLLDRAEVLNICITPDHQGNGYGSRLLAEVIGQLPLEVEVALSGGAGFKLFRYSSLSQPWLCRGGPEAGLLCYRVWSRGCYPDEPESGLGFYYAFNQLW